MKKKTNKIYPCTECDKSFDSQNALSGHMAAHRLEYLNCQFCNKMFGEFNLSSHELACMHNPDNYRVCPECGEQIFNRDNKFCNRSCAASNNNRKYPKWESLKQTIKCLNCPEEISYIVGHPLSINNKPRKYCSVQCQKDYEWQERVIIIESGGIESISKYEPTQRDILKGYLIWKHGEKCMECGWCEVNKWTGIIPIQIEHIDGNPHNQSLDNLALLCPSCHSLTEFFGSRGKGRKGMIRPQMKNKKEYLDEVYGEIKNE
jgi:hypothetical protein